MNFPYPVLAGREFIGDGEESAEKFHLWQRRQTFFSTFFVTVLAFLALAFPLEAARELRVGSYEYPPLISTNAEGISQGVFVEVIEHVARQNDWKLTFVHGSWEENLARVASGEIDLVLGIAQIPERALVYSCNEVPVLSTWAQVYCQKGAQVKTILDLDKKRVAVLRGDINYSALKELSRAFSIQPQFVERGTMREVFELVNSGGAMACVCERTASLVYEARFPLVRTPIIFLPQTLGFCTTKDKNQDVLEAIDRHLKAEQARAGSYLRRATDKWLAVELPASLPPILVWGLPGALVLLLVSTAAAFLLKRQIRRQTSDLQRQNEMLHAQIAERQKAENALRESEAKYRTVLENMQDVFYRTDNQGKLLLLSPSASRLMGGISSEELINTNILGWYQDLAERKRFLQAIQATGSVSDYEITLKRRDGTLIYIATNSHIYRDAEGNSLGVEGVFRDITHRRQAEQALRQSEEKFAKAFRASPVAFTITHLKNNVIVDVNKSFENLLGYSRNELIGHTGAELGLWEDPKDREDLGRDLVERNSLLNRECRLRAKDRRVLITRVSTEVFEISGELCVLAVLQDLTEQKRAEEALKQQLAFDALMTRILTRFACCSLGQVDAAITDALREFSEFIGVDHAYVGVFASNRAAWGLTHEWCAPNLPTFIDKFQDIPLGTLLYNETRILSNQVVRICTRADYPARAQGERQFLADFGVQSLLAVPIANQNDQLTGAIGLLPHVRAFQWTDNDVARLQMVGDAIATLIERKRTEEAMIESEEKFKAIYEGSHDAVILISDGVFFDCNKRALELFGCEDLDEFLGLSMARVSPPFQSGGQESSHLAEVQMEKALHDGHNRFQWIHRRENSQEFPADVLFSTFNIGKKKVIEATVRDISDLKRVEDEIRKLNSDLELRVRQRTADLALANEKLQTRTRELEIFNKAMMGREKRVIELKEEINSLCEELKRPPVYPPIWREQNPADNKP